MRNRDDRFEGVYEVEDGYAGGARPQHFTISPGEIEDDADDDALNELFDGAMDEHFRNNIGTSADNRDEFIEWAREVIAKRKQVETPA